MPTSLKIGAHRETKPEEIAAAFNEHFSCIADTILNEANIQRDNLNSQVYLNNVLHFINSCSPNTDVPSLYIQPMTENFLSLQITKLPEHKAKGYDSINVKLLKIAKPHILQPLLYIYNTSITSGSFPDQWKIAKITPVYKSGQKDNVDNYRPISVLSPLSKILESYMSINLRDHLTKYNLLSEFQYGSRPNHSCETLLINLTDKWLEAMDNGNLTGLLLIDFRKAFDIINHKILIDKLSCYGINGTVLQWFISYLSDRKQRVFIGAASSDSLPVVSGVPQGSCLGPLLFLIYVNEIPSINTFCNTHLYVDDTTLHHSSSSVYDLNTILQQSADVLSSWSKANQMVIHPKKSKAMILGSSRKLVGTDESLNILIDGERVKQSNCEKLLGVHIDSSLSWNDHVFKTVKQFNSKLEVLRKAKPLLSLKNTLTLYNSITKPTIEYCCSVWGNCSVDLLQNLTLAQKRAARLLLGSSRHSRSFDLFQKLNFTPICDVIRIRLLDLTYKALNGQTTPAISSLLVKPSHRYQTRSKNNLTLVLPSAKTNAGRRRFSSIATLIWNSLPDEMHQIDSHALFMNRCNSYYREKLIIENEIKTDRLY